MQRRTLTRARDLASFRDALVHRALAGGPLAARRRALIVPTRASGELLRQTIEAAALDAAEPSAFFVPELLTRDAWMTGLHAALPDAPPMLTPIERHVLFGRAARLAARRPSLGGAPFTIRPGLIAAMLAFYDELRRRQRTVRRFAGSLFDQLRVERGTDRGSEGLIHQTAYLGFAFLAYERLRGASGAMDEHMLRDVLLAEQPRLPYDEVVVAVADHPSDPRGLWPADFDLLGRLQGLAGLDIVMTDETHDAGLRERLEGEIPGITEVRHDRPAPPPMLVRPAADETPIAFVSRDREDELREVARHILAAAERTGGDLCDPVAIVFARPLPYLYLAQQVLGEARIPFQTFDALPLAAEPYAALLDLVLAVARSGGDRDATLAVLRSALVRFDEDGEPVALEDAAALAGVLSERRAVGTAESWPREVDAFFGDREMRRGLDRGRARRAAAAGAAVKQALDPFVTAGRSSDRLGCIGAFLRAHERLPEAGDAWRDRHARARAAVLGVLDGLARAFARHDDGPEEPRTPEAFTAQIRHAIEARTFTPAHGTSGVRLVDAVAARFGSFADVHLVGLVETDWPERPRRSIFYAGGLLTALAWPAETDQRRSELAAFRDLLGLASRTMALHAFELEGDAIVAPSPMLELARGLSSTTLEETSRRVFADEVLTTSGPVSGLEPAVAEWLALRRARPAIDTPAYSGFVAAQPPQPYRVSRVDRYVACPFKYFAESVLALPEERDEVSGLSPLERGTLLHELFERFYREWERQGRGEITPATLPDAMREFAAITRTLLVSLPEPDRALEETRLLGSIVARGVAERVFELEADAGSRIARRLLEFELVGAFPFPQVGGFKQKSIEIRGKADRIDVLENGSLRVVDYKLGRMPDIDESVQIAVYAHCAQQWLEREDRRPHPIESAMYLAFGDDRKLEGRLGSSTAPAPMAVLALAQKFADTTDAIERGEFPPRPRRPADCQWCTFAGVCRKEYPAENDGPADAV
ncbi:MAG TPA: PD-(D/E)XK nuclease family protein [Vicinamibacterales bacterium]|nr:PD-(D/E)XK nuclease family protein [Vicinamibacterales bacterium]